MQVIIGVDPHKASHTAVAIASDERELATIKVRSTRKQVLLLLAWAEPFGARTWAIESAGGLGYLLAQQLVDAGETVVDVPATLAARVRVLGSGRSNKNDPNDALSVAVAALRAPALRPVQAADHSEMLRLLAKRNIDIGNQRTRVVCRLHALLAALAQGGIAKELNASDAEELLRRLEPATPVEQARRDLAVELLDDVRRLDGQLKESHRRIRVAVRASGTSLTDLFGVGPILACALIGYSGDVRRFATGTSSPPTTARPQSSSPRPGGSSTSYPSAGTVGSTTPSISSPSARSASSAGRAYFDRKVAEGKTKKEALRALKRHVSNAVYRQLLVDADRAER
jgi:transposase